MDAWIHHNKVERKRGNDEKRKEQRLQDEDGKDNEDEVWQLEVSYPVCP